MSADVAETEEGATGQEAVDGLVRLLDLERIEVDIFRGTSPKSALQRVFGGQVAGQALVAAGRTVPDDRHVHSLHSYFIRPGDPAFPIVYEVDRMRDGRSFSTRRVIAMQHGKPIFTLSASFQLEQRGIEHQSAMPDVPSPRDLPDAGRPVRDSSPDATGCCVRRATSRSTCATSTTPWSSTRRPARGRCSRVWMRADGTLPDDPLLHVCVLTFASDMTLLDSVLVRQGLSRLDDRSRWPRSTTRCGSSGRSVPTSGCCTRRSRRPPRRPRARDRPVLHPDGEHWCSVVQEGMIRIAAPRAESQAASTWRRSVSRRADGQPQRDLPVDQGVRQVHPARTR